MNQIKVLNKSFNVGSFYDTHKDAYDCWTLEGDEVNDEMRCFITHTEDKKTLLDIGCLVGAFSLMFSDGDKVSHAIDGSHEGCLQLLQNIVLNPDKKIYPHKILIGDMTGYRSYWTKPGDLHALSFEGSDKIIMMTVDDFCNLYSVAPDVIKVDTEGYEVRILQNAHETISTYKPLIFMEGHNNFVYNYKNTVEELVDIAKKYDYRIYDMLDKELSYDEYLTKLKQKEYDSTRTYWK